MRVLGVIPARLGSTRLPHKPLQLLAGEPLVTRVVQRVREYGLVDTLVVATDASMVARVAERAGVATVLTDANHGSGTDRVAEVASRPEYAGFDIVVNIQADEPFLPVEALAGAIERVRSGDDIGTAAAPLEASFVGDPNRVKVVTDANGRALYFSRAPIPFARERRECGITWAVLAAPGRICLPSSGVGALGPADAASGGVGRAARAVAGSALRNGHRGCAA